MKKSYRKGNLLLLLDKHKVIPNDPGADTPAMVYLMRGNDYVASATYWCATGEGVLHDSNYGDYRLSNSQLSWLESLDGELTNFLYR